jgi:galactokinase
MMIRLKEYFEEIFGDSKDTRIFFAPGRVNLIGEHTDYNGGHVFPCALNFGTYGIARKRKDDKVKFYSRNFPKLGVIEFNINDLKYVSEHDWANYPKGVINIFKESGYQIGRGLEVLFYGNIPNGAGLSSSASIELVTSVMLNELFNFHIDMISMIKMSQRAENQFCLIVIH